MITSAPWGQSIIVYCQWKLGQDYGMIGLFKLTSSFSIGAG